jgi:extradiol dioxygenase family protein
MFAKLRRPELSARPGDGLLMSEHFEIAYATNDLDRAKAVFADRFGITHFAPLGGALPEGGEIRILLGWAGGVMYELLTASGPGSAVYVEKLPTDRFAIQHHHLGYLIHNAEEWAALATEIARRGWTVRVDTNIEGFMRQIFVEVPELGHLLEYLWPEPAGVAFFDTIPSN